jgi:hypothetical protein
MVKYYFGMEEEKESFLYYSIEFNKIASGQLIANLCGC